MLTKQCSNEKEDTAQCKQHACTKKHTYNEKTREKVNKWMRVYNTLI